MQGGSLGMGVQGRVQKRSLQEPGDQVDAMVQPMPLVWASETKGDSVDDVLRLPLP